MFLEIIEKYHFADSTFQSYFEFSDFPGPPTIIEQHYPELFHHLSSQISLSHVSFISIRTLPVESSQSPQYTEAGLFEKATYMVTSPNPSGKRVRTRKVALKNRIFQSKLTDGLTV